MRTQCSAQQYEFEAVGRRAVVAAFDGGAVSSDAGALLLAGLDRGVGLIKRFAGCFEDRRDPDLIG
ncbi:MAG: transposase [Burkholderiales bacterium]